MTGVTLLDKRIKRLIMYYLKHFETNDPFKIAEILGIKVFFEPLGKYSGMYKYLAHTRCIFLNSGIEDEVFLSVVMAHELGHAVLHWKENCCFMAHHTLMLTSKTERQANWFAAYLLITQDMLNDFAGCTKDQFCRCTGYPMELIDLRLK